MKREQLAAVPALVRAVGVLEAVRLGWALERAQRRGEPFAALPPATTDKERESRAQAGPAILLYRALAARLGKAEALAIVEQVTIAGAVAFLRQSVGQLERARLEAMDEPKRKAWVAQRGERFPNASMRVDEASDERVVFTVTACRFPPLCAAAGVPELAPVFCAGDERFFGDVQRDVVLDRPQTIAAGDPQCVFRLSWRDGGPA